LRARPRAGPGPKLSNAPAIAPRARDAWRFLTEIYGENPRGSAARELCVDSATAKNTVQYTIVVKRSFLLDLQLASHTATPQVKMAERAMHQHLCHKS
jgi:hypothetical protein